ncbi:ribonuclease D [Vespertiliibacter pulmonis]|uniref:Ribonuclease D n=1 Tax=Vespertiliibacter pulmonis TaxID=1443036 RepID=A0A3N4W0P6_9PAST|nr:ribonuclease D [Vespertiliibacter pulmonis]QLB21493.1 ribonuclease D [Vespertiliibacter pulmonis]RPE85909.1 ribonuclease D [Vespertiliibacter pulmonis]
MDNQNNFIWIESNEQLEKACNIIQQANIIALDTEFVRIRSYYPKLGLIQLFDNKNVYLIDPLAITNFQPFVEILRNPTILKVLHACSEDLEVFQHTFQQLPEPMIDTQIMSSFLGLGTSVGFSKLVSHFCQIELDKSASRTNWLTRPLTSNQLQYAVSDVRYLLPVYTQLQAKLAQTRWHNAVIEECINLKNKKITEIDSEKAYKKITNAWQLTPQQLSVLQILEKWRIEEAKKRDLALNFIVKEQALWQIAKTQPKHTASLIEFMHPNEIRLHGKKLLLLVEQAKQIPPESYPNPISRLIDIPYYKQEMAFLRNTVKQCSPEDLALEVFASKRQLEQLIKWQIAQHHHLPELLIGWRKPFGEKLWELYQNFKKDLC